MLWQTDELRMDEPDPVDDARAVIYYFDELFTNVLPDLLHDVNTELTWYVEELVPTTELRHLQDREDDRRGVGKRNRSALAPEYAERYIREIRAPAS